MNPTSTNPIQNPESLASGDQEVLTSVFNFEGFIIKKFSYDEVTVLAVEGKCAPHFRRELERLAMHVRGDLGLDLSKLSGLQPSTISILKGLQKRFENRNKQFFLCNPSERLLDLLKLGGQTQHFQIARDSEAHLPVPLPSVPGVDLRDFEESDPQARRKITHLTQSLKRTEVLEKGLDSASECVRRFLPSEAPVQEGYSFSFASESCDKVGGDFFDFFPLGDDLLGISIGDVSGHGIDSAIIMGMSKKVLRLRARELVHESPAEVLARANDDLFEDLGRKLFVTALYGRLELSTGEFTFARAGHEPPVYFKPGTHFSPRPLRTEGIALGMTPAATFRGVIESATIQLVPGDALLLYTDGIVEAWNPRHDLFSRKRLNYVLEKTPTGSTAEGILTGLQAAVTEFSGGSPSEDDQTAIVITRTA